MSMMQGDPDGQEQEQEQEEKIETMNNGDFLNDMSPPATPVAQQNNQHER